MRKTLYIVLLAGLVYSCGPKVKLPEGAPPYLKTEKLIEKAQEGSLDFETLVLKGKGRFEDSKQKQSFRFEIRIAKDSLIWVDVADPFIGIKVARGQLSREKLSFYNRLERNYQEGSSSELAKSLGFSFDFEPMMSVLSASFLEWNQKWYQDYQPGNYQLVNYPLEEGQAPPSSEYPLITQMLSPREYRNLEYHFRRPQNGQDMQIVFSEYKSFDALSFPESLELKYTEAQKNLRIQLEFSDVIINKNLSYPFRIPPSYEKL